MKQLFRMVFVVIVMAVAGAACSAEGTESDTEEGSVRLGELANDSEENLGANTEALMTRIDVEAVCEVIKTKVDAYCPSTIVGHGWTRPPFPSCRKAHSRAIDDARSQLGDGCSLGSCQFSGC